MSKPLRTAALSLILFSVLMIFLLVLIKINIDNQARYLCELTRANPNQTMSECPAHKSNISWLITGSFGGLFFILATGLYILFLDSYKKEKKQFKKINMDSLKDDEKKIYQIIKSKQGSVYQSELIKETGFSKVKITRILDKLETKAIIERRRRGMTNIIFLR